MRMSPRLALLLALVLAVVAAVAPATGTRGQAAPAGPVAAARSPGAVDAVTLAAAMRAGGCTAAAPARSPAAVAVQPKQEPCLHCHISGEAKAPTTPPLRWALFGLAGLFFALGMVRSASVWQTRSPWKPLWQRAVGWVDDRYEVVAPLKEAVTKPVPRFARQWMYCLGGMTAFVFAVQCVTGIMLAFYYQPTAAAAYASIEYIEKSVRFGAQVRTIHAWSANAMIVLCVAHMLRTFIVGAYKKPRELNWVSGVVLLAVTMVFGFTGYLLPWDQRAFWATTVGSDIAGGVPAIGNFALVMMRVGWNVTEATLGRFYALHVIVVPIATIGAMLAHFYMVRRLGIYRPL
jgi:hypothetical protein